jgi:hypothetical protein
MRILICKKDGDDDGGGGGGGDDKWQDALPEAVRAWDEVTKVDSPEKFWDQMTNMRSFIGQSIRIPGDNASAEDMTAFNQKLLSKVPGLIPTPDYKNEDSTKQFYNALGRPESHDKYTNPQIDNKGVTLDMAPVEAFKPIAHKHGLTQKQFEGVVADMTAGNIDASVATHLKLQEDQTALKNEWGMAYENNLKRIGFVAKNTGAPVALQDAITAGNIDGPTAKWLLGVANSFKGEGVNLNLDKNNEHILNPEQAKKEISEIMNNKKHDYWNPASPGNKAAKEYMTKLYKMAQPASDSAASISLASVNTVGAGGGIQFK